jgi:hypothetical protein
MGLKVLSLPIINMGSKVLFIMHIIYLLVLEKGQLG